MNIRTFLAVAASSVVPAVAIYAGPIQGNKLQNKPNTLRLELVPLISHQYAGEPLEFDVKITNISSETFYLYRYFASNENLLISIGSGLYCVYMGTGSGLPAETAETAETAESCLRR